MKKFMSIMLGLTLFVGAATVSFAGDDKMTTKKEKKEKKKKSKKSTEKM
ncbi:MAG: hypothetical protein ABI823_17240 [Bryobacteraceae bacterium]